MTELACHWTAFLPHQQAFFDWEPAPDSEAPTTVEALLGGYGSGKSVAGARKTFRRCAAAAWRPEYGLDGRSQAAVIAPTNRILLKVTMPKLEQIIPRDLILSKRKSPYPSITLINGCEINFVSADAEFEGEDLHTIWCDEIQHDVYTGAKFTNFMARLRDPHQAVRSMIVTGLPMSGRVRETFDLSQLEPAARHNRVTILASTRDNPHIPAETLAQIMATVPSGEEANLIGGQWMMPPNAVFTTFDNAKHLTDERGDPNAATSMGIDVGQHGAVVWGQDSRVKEHDILGRESMGTGLLICDQMLTEGQDVEGMLVAAKLKPWNIVAGRSEIYVDPTIRGDELRTIRRHFPGVNVVVRERDDEYYSKEPGIRLLQAALLNAFGDTHLTINRALAQEKHGIVDSIVSARRYERTGSIVKDDSKDHVLDAARYLAIGRLRPKGRLPTARPR